MKFGLFLGIIFAVLLHIGFILFGGLLFLGATKDHGTLQQVELISEDEVEKEEEKPEETITEELETETEEIPDAEELLRNLEQTPMDNTPELEAVNLAAIEAALSGAVDSGGDFSYGATLEGGGKIGGRGKAGALDDGLENAFSLAEIDQEPRATFQAEPVYPAQMRGKKIEGAVTVIFVTDSSGKVVNPRVAKSNNAAFEKPALDAVKKWKFEPAIKGGERVACKMRVTIRFPAS